MSSLLLLDFDLERTIPWDVKEWSTRQLEREESQPFTILNPLRHARIRAEMRANAPGRESKLLRCGEREVLMSSALGIIADPALVPILPSGSLDPFTSFGWFDRLRKFMEALRCATGYIDLPRDVASLGYFRVEEHHLRTSPL